MKRFILYCFVLLAAPALVIAQSGDCPTIVQTALAATEALCDELGRNQACYGNLDITASPQADVKDFKFDTTGDVVNVADIQSMRLAGLDEESGRWGVAVLRLQANLPDTLPGQNVTLLMFGDVEITNAVEPGSEQAPMQAFYLKTGVADSACDEAPESGLLVQTPEGAEEIAFNVNGVDVQMGSTVLFQASTDTGEMTVSTLEGSAFVAANEGVQLIPQGSWVGIGLDSDLRATGAPALPESYEGRARLLRALPLRLLQRRIEIAPPLTSDQIDLIRERLEAGELPCGGDFLPSCARLRRYIATGARVCLAMPADERPAFCERLRTAASEIREIIIERGEAAATVAPSDNSGSSGGGYGGGDDDDD